MESQSYSRQQFEEEHIFAVVGGQRVVSSDRVLHHQVADQGDDQLGTPVAVTNNENIRAIQCHYCFLDLLTLYIVYTSGTSDKMLQTVSKTFKNFNAAFSILSCEKEQF